MVQATPTDTGGRTAFGMTYDATLGRVVEFGGRDATYEYNDQWMWNGSDWVQGNQSSNAAAAYSFALVQAAGHGQMLLQGYSSAILFDWDVAGATKANTQDTHAIDDRSQYGVNPYNTNVRVSATDFSDSGVGEDLNLTREYNSTTGPSQFGSAGWGWVFAKSSTPCWWAVTPFIFNVVGPARCEL